MFCELLFVLLNYIHAVMELGSDILTARIFDNRFRLKALDVKMYELAKGDKALHDRMIQVITIRVVSKGGDGGTRPLHFFGRGGRKGICPPPLLDTKSTNYRSL
jgi:hypothetical protein